MGSVREETGTLSMGLVMVADMVVAMTRSLPEVERNVVGRMAVEALEGAVLASGGEDVEFASGYVGEGRVKVVNVRLATEKLLGRVLSGVAEDSAVLDSVVLDPVVLDPVMLVSVVLDMVVVIIVVGSPELV